MDAERERMSRVDGESDARLSAGKDGRGLSLPNADNQSLLGT